MPRKTSPKRRPSISIVLADHRPFTRSLIASRLSAAGFTIIAELNDATAALAACSAAPHPDILLLRSDLPGYSPFAAARNLRLQGIPTRAAVIFPTILDQQLEEAIVSGTDAMFSHEDTPEQLIKGLQELHANGTHRAPSIEQRLITLKTDEDSPARHASPITILTNRERDILRLIAEGMTQREIADRVGLAPKTIDNHAGKLMMKLGLHNRVLLTRYAIREGIIAADDPFWSPAKSTAPA